MRAGTAKCDPGSSGRVVLGRLRCGAVRPLLAGLLANLVRTRFGRGPRIEDERRTLEHVARAPRFLATVKDVAELVAEVASRHIAVSRIAPLPDAYRRIVQLERQRRERGRSLAHVAHRARGEYVDARIRARVRHAHAQDALLRDVHRLDSERVRRAGVRHGAHRARDDSALADAFPCPHDGYLHRRDVLRPEREAVVAREKPHDPQHAVRVRAGTDAVSRVTAVLADGEQRDAVLHLVRARPRAVEEPAHRQLDRLALGGRDRLRPVRPLDAAVQLPLVSLEVAGGPLAD